MIIWKNSLWLFPKCLKRFPNKIFIPSPHPIRVPPGDSLLPCLAVFSPLFSNIIQIFTERPGGFQICIQFSFPFYVNIYTLRPTPAVVYVQSFFLLFQFLSLIFLLQDFSFSIYFIPTHRQECIQGGR